MPTPEPVIPAAVYSKRDASLGEVKGSMMKLLDPSERTFDLPDMKLVGYQEALIVIGKPLRFDDFYDRYAHPADRDAETVRMLDEAFPGDPGIVLALLLNRATLRPGEVLYLPAGNIHAYLRGLGIELMAASDNVLRGGLTRKRIDVPELVSVLDFSPIRATPLPAGGDRARWCWATRRRRPPRRSSSPAGCRGASASWSLSSASSVFLTHRDAARQCRVGGPAKAGSARIRSARAAIASWTSR